MLLSINNDRNKYNYTFKQGVIKPDVYEMINRVTNDKLQSICNTANKNKENVDIRLLKEVSDSRKIIVKKLKDYMMSFPKSITLYLGLIKDQKIFNFGQTNKDMIFDNQVGNSFPQTFENAEAAINEILNVTASERQENMLNECVEKAELLAKEANSEAFEYIDIIDDLAKTLNKENYLKKNFKPHIEKLIANKENEKREEMELCQKNENITQQFFIPRNGEKFEVPDYPDITGLIPEEACFSLHNYSNELRLNLIDCIGPDFIFDIEVIKKIIDNHKKANEDIKQICRKNTNIVAWLTNNLDRYTIKEMLKYKSDIARHITNDVFTLLNKLRLNTSCNMNNKKVRQIVELINDLKTYIRQQSDIDYEMFNSDFIDTIREYKLEKLFKKSEK